MKTALIIVDIQNDYFPGGKYELTKSLEASQKAKDILMHFRQKGLTVIHIQHLSVRPGSTFFLPGSEGAEIHANVAPIETEMVIHKNYPSSFRETGLHQQLREQGVKHLVISGMMSHMCVDATARAARDLGYQVTVAADACATKDLSFQGKRVRAPEVHNASMAALSYFYADVKNADELIHQL